MSTKDQLRPRNIFLKVFVIVFVLLTLVDVLRQTTQSPNIFDSGNFFLAQCVAIFVVTVLVIARRTPWRYVRAWVVTSLACLILIGLSFSYYYIGPRIATEADGPASIGYLCVWAESYDTVTSITGAGTPLTENICVLKNMPLAASNATYRYTDPDVEASAFLMFFIWEAIIAGVYFLTRTLTYSNYTHGKQQSDKTE